MRTFKTIGLGGGCHWCTEAVFQQVSGVSGVRQGYIASSKPYQTWSEAILLDYHKDVDLEQLIDIHLQTHASTHNHSRRSEYRSAIYYFDDVQKNDLEIGMSSLSRKRNTIYVTQLLPFVEFKESRDSIQNYYRTRPDAPFCKRYIEPKIEIAKTLLKKD